MIREACVENIREALLSQEKGANRIELCENLSLGGTTPSFGMVKTLKKYLKIPIVAMLRPRGGDFIYNREEIESMEEDLKLFKSLEIDGVALGFLNSKNEVDLKLTESFVKLAYPLKVTFHKAIDETRDIKGEVEKLLSLKIERILSSGGKKSASEGRETLRELLKLCSFRAELVVAGGVREDNLAELDNYLNAKAYHGKLIVGSLSS